jgi:phage terminase large subunit GpA-like protein
MRKGKRRTLPGLADWIEANVELPQGLAAEPGRVKLWPWQRAIADAISDPALERVTLLKPTRVGFTCLLTSAIAYYVVRDPAPILVLLPTEADCRDFLVSDVASSASARCSGIPPAISLATSLIASEW